MFMLADMDATNDSTQPTRRVERGLRIVSQTIA
jgi:hypothetical protein